MIADMYRTAGYALVLVFVMIATGLGGCATASKLSPEQIRALNESIDKLRAAGCGGSFSATVGGATGQLGGAADARITVTANCPAGGAVPIPPGVVSPPDPVGGRL